VEFGGAKRLGCSLLLLERSGVNGKSQPQLRCVACTPEQTDFLLGKPLSDNTAAARQVLDTHRLNLGGDPKGPPHPYL